MIKKDVTFVDFDGNKETETHWFHISQSNLTDHVLRLQPKFLDMQKRLSGDKKTLTVEEVILILDLIKEMVRISYGVRFEKDGKTRFRQTDEVFQDFRDSPAYDALLTSFMENPSEGMDFMQAVMPQNLIEQAQKGLPFADGGQPDAVGTDVAFPQETKAAPNPLEGLSQQEIQDLVAKAQANQ
jgi:hypothetical protein